MASRIFYFAQAHSRPTGGQKQVFRHVDILRDAGFDAYAFHDGESLPMPQFTTKAPVLRQSAFRATVRLDDFVVLPGDLGERALDYPGRKIIFNQSLYHGFSALGLTRPTRPPVLDPSVVAVFTVSAHNEDGLRLAYPQARILRIQLAVDAARFGYVPLAEKEPLIATIQKPHAGVETQALFHIIDSRAAAGVSPLGAFRWVFIKDMDEAAVQTCLGRALVLVFLSAQEGSPLLPLEAFASGCLLVTYDAGPIREYAPQACRFRVGDLPGLVRYIEEIGAAYPNGLSRFMALAEEGRTVAERFSLAAERGNVVAIWRELLDAAPRSTT